MNVNPDQWHFVDTNIFLYAYDNSEPEKQQQVQVLSRELWRLKRGCLSIQVLQELYVNLTRKIKKPLDRLTALMIISDLGQWKYHSPDLLSLQEAADSEESFKISFRDALIICSARQLNCDTLWTEDLNHGQDYKGVKAVNPFIGVR